MTQNFIFSAALTDERLARPDWATTMLRRCEDAGLDLVTLGSPDALPFDAVVIAAFAAPLLRRMAVASSITTGLGHPFHAARALSSIDFLSGANAAWCPMASHGDPAAKAADFALAARALWDGWSDDTMIIDKASGRYLDGASVRVPGYVGPFYMVRGPVNAARPPQGHPVMLVDDAAPFALAGVDLALARDPAAAPKAEKILLKIGADYEADAILEQFATGAIAGVHLLLDDADALPAAAAALAERVAAHRPAAPEGSGLRTRLGLSPAPQPVREGAIA